VPRRNRRQVKQKRNKGNHQRRRTTRGYRFMSKLEKYKWYDPSTLDGTESDTPKHAD
jgi:hypothetical protein